MKFKKVFWSTRLSKNLLDHIPTTQLYGVRASLEFLDLTQMGGVAVVRNHAFHGLANLRTLVINSMPLLQKIEALGRGLPISLILFSIFLTNPSSEEIPT